MNDLATNPSDAACLPPSARDVARLSEQLDELNARLLKLDHVQQSLESIAAISVDVADEQAQRCGDTDRRIAQAMALVERLTRPEALAALNNLAERAPQLEYLLSLVDTAPDALAMFTDVVDDWAQSYSEQGVDLIEAVRRGIRAAVWLGERISEQELERLGTLLRSDMLDPNALAVVANAATALAQTQQATHQSDRPQKAGLLSGLRALSNPRTQQSLAFAIQFSQAFGDLVGQSCCGSTESEDSR
ncbi:hypothetical protein NG895_00230 [Aeoliella sp. ICT_H6.2]|uniref:DUF1641 domain-containing protein n=1 Tax=Aeoliella straminimaris TaxID=2954799 RepID=A0A9X2F506_9BACT|nr:hypothetical protein [Aeoliella straminimaris]MCO6042320.1 hypothetical protein [Aeoliella straminimaris]